ncbi:DUF2490 domain-containing protein [Formosa undariae]|uniref:DUF2490 domain-containing protein n=1 Tax=Formosa undariae TaxID=1325436 RepID=A0ABV5EWV0_9FLAO
MGSWFMYAFNTEINESQWGFQGDIQHRNWNVSGDLEQLLLRGGVHYTPKNSRLKLTAGYAYIQSGYYDSSEIQNHENRIYQEARIPQKIGSRFYLAHRFRFEQRIVQNQDFRTRFRYALSIDVPINNRLLIPKTWYVTVYDEIFINGQKDIGNDIQVDLFDRNRAYFGIGYIISPHLKSTFGFLRQSTSTWSKNQFVLSLFHNI